MNDTKFLRSVLIINNLSEYIIFGRRILNNNIKIRDEHIIIIGLFVYESSKINFKEFCLKIKLNPNQNFKSEYTKHIKQIIKNKYRIGDEL